MDSQEELKLGIGNIEPEKVSLKPALVKIVNVKIETLSKAKKVSFEVKHPAKEETIKISSVAYLVGREVKVTGTWLNLDRENKIQKGSALAVLLNKLSVLTIEQVIGKEIETELDDKYLCFKAY